MRISKTISFGLIISFTIITLLFLLFSTTSVFASQKPIDRLFQQPSYNFNAELAKVALELSTSAYGDTPETIETALNNYGFTNDETHDSNSYLKASEKGANSVAFSLANKTLNADGQEYNLIAVVIRGTSGQNEWISNFNINNSGLYPTIHEGFDKATKEILSSLQEYLKELNTTKANTKILVTGHSRGAAVANLLAADLSSSETFANDQNIYAYTFATPNVAKFDSQQYFNIFNALDNSDIITLLPLEEWGYSKYGVNYTTLDLKTVNQSNLASTNKLISEITTVAPNLESFYKSKLVLYLLEGDKIPKETMEAHTPQSYMTWLNQADPKALEESVLDLQLELIPNNNYA
ncbi:MAG: lipase family protein [Aminipila sp.]